MRTWMRVATKMRWSMPGMDAKPLSARPQSATPWLPPTSCSRLAIVIMLACWSGPHSLPLFCGDRDQAGAARVRMMLGGVGAILRSGTDAAPITAKNRRTLSPHGAQQEKEAGAGRCRSWSRRMGHAPAQYNVSSPPDPEFLDEGRVVIHKLGRVGGWQHLSQVALQVLFLDRPISRCDRINCCCCCGKSRRGCKTRAPA